MVPLMMPMASYKKVMFQLSWPKECSGAIGNASASTNGVTWLNKSCCALFQSSWSKECISAIDDTTGIAWCWWQWHDMTKKVMLHLILIVLTKGMQWCHWQSCWHHVTPVAMPVVSHDQKVMLHLVSIVWTYVMQWCHWCHVMSMAVQMALDDQESCCMKSKLHWHKECIGVDWWCYQHHVMLMPEQLHDQRSHFAPHLIVLT